MQQELARHLAGPCEAKLPDRLFGVQQERPLVSQPCGIPDATADLSHELRTSLAIITLLCGNLDRLYERLGDDERRRMIQRLRHQMQRLNELVGDVLARSEHVGSVSM
jgi:signal transduction histidine kinase